MEHEDMPQHGPPPEGQVPESQAPEPAGSDHGLFEGLDDKQVQAITVLLHEPTITRAAKTLDLNEKTLRRWMREPRFIKAYHAARREAYDHAVGLLQHYAPMAVHMLAKVLNDDRTPPAGKIAAAAHVLKFSREGIELDDMAQRLELLERSAEMTAKWQGRP